jgi:hypothetical protein
MNEKKTHENERGSTEIIEREKERTRKPRKEEIEYLG